MNNEELLKKMRAARFIENNGRVLRTINILRHKYEQLKDIRFALDDLEEAGFLDCINFLTEAGYIKLRSVASKACSAIEDADYTLLEAKLTEKGIRLLSGQLADNMVADTRIRTLKIERGQTQLNSEVCQYFRSNRDSVY